MSSRQLGWRNIAECKRHRSRPRRVSSSLHRATTTTSMRRHGESMTKRSFDAGPLSEELERSLPLDVSGVTAGIHWKSAQYHLAKNAEGRYRSIAESDGRQAYVLESQVNKLPGRYCLRYDEASTKWIISWSHAQEELTLLCGTANCQQWTAGNGCPIPSMRVTQIQECPVCGKTEFGSLDALTSHMLNKKDSAHEKYRHRAHSEQPAAVKRQRTRSFTEAEKDSNNSADETARTDERGADAQHGIRKTHCESMFGAVGTMFGAVGGIVSRACHPLNSTKQSAVQDTGTETGTIGSGSGNYPGRDTSHQQPADKELCLAKKRTDTLTKKLAKLRDEHSALMDEHSALKQAYAELRAAHSAAAPGNDNVNSSFPLNQEIIKDYKKLCGDIWEMLDSGEEELDLPWICEVSEFIFHEVNKRAQELVADPQNSFKDAVMAVNGPQVVADWGPVQVHMTKLQRKTRTRILERHTDDLRAFVRQGGRDHGSAAHISKLTSQGEYKQGSLEKCVEKLLEVESSGELNLPVAYAHNVLMDGLLAEPCLTVSPSSIARRLSFSSKLHKALEGRPKEGEQCIIILPNLLHPDPSPATEAYVMPFNEIEEIKDSDEDDLPDPAEDDVICAGESRAVTPLLPVGSDPYSLGSHQPPPPPGEPAREGGAEEGDIIL